MQPLIALFFCLFFLASCESEAPPRAEKIYQKKDEIYISGVDFKELKETNKACIKRTKLTEGISPSDFSQSTNLHAKDFNTILSCTLTTSESSRCSFEELDFLIKNKPLTISAIHERVIATDAWMQNNFKTLLAKMPNAMLALFGSITAVIIHPSVEFGFFSPSNGALFISPKLLALTQAEKNTAIERHNALFFCQKPRPWPYHYYSRYLLTDKTAFDDQLATDKTWRNVPDFNSQQLSLIDQSTYALASVLFHELAHANDFFPADALTFRNQYSSPAQWLKQNDLSITESLLITNSSNVLKDAAKTHFEHKQPTDLLTSTSIESMALEFSRHPISDLYGHLAPAEGMAILFEEWAMKVFFNLDREVAFIEPINPEQQGCSNLIFHQGQINRLLDNERLSKATNIAKSLLTTINIDQLPPLIPAKKFFGCQSKYH
jgi:hypothetical protein